jgi:hypothetical protein
MRHVRAKAVGNTVRAPRAESPDLEIVTFNVAGLDVSALDVRLELTILVPEVSGCPQNTVCPSVTCNVNTGCNCDSYNS